MPKMRWMFAVAGLLLGGIIGGGAAETGARFNIRTWTVDEGETDPQLGLPQGSVTAMTQARDGYLWLATQRGLIRFNALEFESFSLNRETVVEPGQSITVRLPALSPGSYDFYDDFHQDVPEGSIVAK